MTSDTYLICVELPEGAHSPDLAAKLRSDIRLAVHADEPLPLDIVVSPHRGAGAVVTVHPPAACEDGMRGAAYPLEQRLAILQALAEDVAARVLDEAAAARA